MTLPNSSQAILSDTALVEMLYFCYRRIATRQKLETNMFPTETAWKLEACKAQPRRLYKIADKISVTGLRLSL